MSHACLNILGMVFVLNFVRISATTLVSYGPVVNDPMSMGYGIIAAFQWGLPNRFCQYCGSNLPAGPERPCFVKLYYLGAVK